MSLLILSMSVLEDMKVLSWKLTAQGRYRMSIGEHVMSLVLLVPDGVF